MKLLTYQELVSKSFREKLCNNPNAVLGIDESVEIIVKKNSKHKAYFVLNSPRDLEQQDLNIVGVVGAGMASTLTSATSIGCLGTVTGTAGSLSTLITMACYMW